MSIEFHIEDRGCIFEHIPPTHRKFFGSLVYPQQTRANVC
jgi:hypothetical protein